MLILYREINQAIVIADDIQIMFFGMVGSAAKIGIQAPKTIPVHREEVYLKNQQKYFNAQSNGKNSFGYLIGND
jgi:carbon storage regulator